MYSIWFYMNLLKCKNQKAEAHVIDVRHESHHPRHSYQKLSGQPSRA